MTYNTELLTSADPSFAIESTGKLTNDGMDYFMFLVNDIGGSRNLATTDTWVFEFDTGGIDPLYTEGFAGVPDVDRLPDGDGTFHVRYTASPVVYTFGCDTASSVWPWPCLDDPNGEVVKLEAEVWERTDEFVMFHRSQSPQGVNGIFLEQASDGSRFLLSEMVNSHFRDDGATLFDGEVRFRIPYAMLRDSFGVPDPGSMDAGSLSGTVNGSSTAAIFDVAHDPDGGGIIVDITNLHFSKKTIRVKRGVIVPTKPKDLVAKRTAVRTARLAFTLSTPRGAKVKGYQARCVSGSGHVVKALKEKATSPVRVSGLRAGVKYTCKVRAKSKVGYGPYSAKVAVPKRP